LLGTTALLLMPISAPGTAPGNLDKVAHALLMGILALLVWRAVPLGAWLRALFSVFATIAYAGGMELAQGLTPYRTAELADLVASGVGAVLAIAIVVAATWRSRTP
jgi:VanZ family protein